MRGLKTLLATACLTAASLTCTTQAKAQVYIGIQPDCPYGYYNYAPYGCSPQGYYGPGYFYNNIFLGVGPWGGWGYAHGWGDHRFDGARGGSYTGGGGWDAHNRYNSGYRGFDNRGRGFNGRGGGFQGGGGGRPGGNFQGGGRPGNQGGGRPGGQSQHGGFGGGGQQYGGGGGQHGGGGGGQHGGGGGGQHGGGGRH